MNLRSLVLGFSLLACSSTPAADDPGTEGKDAGGATAEGGSPRDDGGSVTTDAAVDAGSDAGTSWRCGHGSFTQADAVIACAVPNMYLDNGPGAAARACDAATISGGTWEVRCSSGPLLVEVQFECITGTGSQVGCMGSTQQKVVSAWSQLNGSGSGMLPKSGAAVTFDIAKPLTVDLATLGNSTSDKSGAGHVYLIGELPPACGTIGARAVVSGVAVQWDAAKKD